MKSQRWTLRFVALFAFFALSAGYLAGAAELTIIELRNRTAEEVIPALRPMIDRDTALSGVDYKLLVRGSAADVARIRNILSVLDRTPRQLIVAVRYSSSPQAASSNVGVGGTVSNRGAQVIVRGGVADSRSTSSNVSTVRVLEGHGAHISAGQSVPIVTTFLANPRGAGRSATISATEFRQVSAGFDVLPRVNGDQVFLDISSTQDQVTDAAGSAAIQRVSTTLSGRLGEWIDVGGVEESSADQTTSIGAGASRRTIARSDQRSVSVKVELVD